MTDVRYAVDFDDDHPMTVLVVDGQPATQALIAAMAASGNEQLRFTAARIQARLKAHAPGPGEQATVVLTEGHYIEGAG